MTNNTSSSLLPVVCMWCGRLQVGSEWKVQDPPRLPVSHGICHECLHEHYPEEIKGCAVCGDTREPVNGWECPGCGSV